MSGRILVSVGSKTAQDPRICTNYVRWLSAFFPDAEVVVVDVHDWQQIDAIIPTVNGVVLTGGADMDPALYKQARHHTTKPDRERDTLEWAILKHVFAAHLPLLGICRGLQITNAFLGGTLVQDIESLGRPTHKRDEVAGRDRPHAIRIDPSTMFSRIVGATNLTINCSHHQSADRIGDGLRLAAVADDVTVEALEGISPDDHWIMLVQWHPERLEDQHSSTLLLQAFRSTMR